MTYWMTDGAGLLLVVGVAACSRFLVTSAFPWDCLWNVHDRWCPGNQKTNLRFWWQQCSLRQDDPDEPWSEEVSRRRNSELLPRSQNKYLIQTCSSTKELCAAVQRSIQPGDSVAELGSQLRDVSTCICQSLQNSGRAILVDVQRKYPKGSDDSDQEADDDSHASPTTRTRAMRRPEDEVHFFPQVATFIEINSLEDWRKPFMNHSLGATGQGYDVLVLDLNAIVGNDLEWTALSIVREFVAWFDTCRLVLIKSVALNQWAARLVHARRWITQQGTHRDIPPPHIVAAVGVVEYRQTIPYTVRPGDAVLEVGCHLGTSTHLLHKQAVLGQGGYALGIDVGPKIVQGAKSRHPHLHFAVGDAWKTAELLRIQARYMQTQANSPSANRRLGFDVVYVDIGGLSGNDGLMEALALLSSLMYSLEPRTIVIKSLCVRRLSSNLVPSWHYQ